MSDRTIKEQVEKATAEAEVDIQRILQAYYNDTGMIPSDICFNIIDVTTCQDLRASICVGRVTLVSHT